MVAEEEQLGEDSAAPCLPPSTTTLLPAVGALPTIIQNALKRYGLAVPLPQTLLQSDVLAEWLGSALVCYPDPIWPPAVIAYLSDSAADPAMLKVRVSAFNCGGSVVRAGLSTCSSSGGPLHLRVWGKDEWSHRTVTCPPQQTQSSDCGVF